MPPRFAAGTLVKPTPSPPRSPPSLKSLAAARLKKPPNPALRLRTQGSLPPLTPRSPTREVHPTLQRGKSAANELLVERPKSSGYSSGRFSASSSDSSFDS